MRRDPRDRAASRRRTAGGGAGRAARCEGLKPEGSRRWLPRVRGQGTQAIAHGSPPRPTWYGPPGAAAKMPGCTGGTDAARSIIRDISRECINSRPSQCSGGCIGSQAPVQVAGNGAIHCIRPRCMLLVQWHKWQQPMLETTQYCLGLTHRAFSPLVKIIAGFSKRTYAPLDETVTFL